MMNREEHLKMLAAYRDLSPAERERLQKVLAEEPAAADLLAEYRKMDEALARLPDPAPDDALREAFYQQVEEQRAALWWAPLRRLPAAAAQAGGLAFLLLVVVVAGWLFREQISQPPAAGPISTARPVAEGAPTLLPQTFAHPTPTYPAEMNLENPFASFGEVMAGWGEETHPSQAFLIMRTAIKIYLQEAGGLNALDDPAVLAGLEERLRPHVPVWPDFALRRADLTGNGQPELMVAVLPLIDVFFEDEDGVLHARSLPQPAHLDVAQAWPHELQLTDVTQDGLPDVLVAFTEGITPGLVATADARYEVLVAQWVAQGSHFNSLLQVPSTATGLDNAVFRTDVAEEGSSVETYCSTHGLFSAPGSPHITQRNVYAWNGVDFELLLYDRTDAETLRQYVNVAEAHLQEGDLADALLFYEALYQDQVTLPDEPAASGFPEWRAYASLRAGQVQALLGDHEAAQNALGRARLSSSAIGQLAGVFGETLQATGDPAAAWAALLADDALAEDAFGEAGNGADVRAAILYPGMALAAALRQHPEVDVGTQVEEVVGEYGLEVSDLTPVDLDEDGAEEVVVRQVLPGDIAAVSLLDQGDEGWFAVLLDSGPAADVPAYQIGDRSVQVGDFQAVWWDGRHATFYPITGSELSVYGGSHLCPLRGDEMVVVQEQPLRRPTAPPTQIGPTLEARSLTATAEGRAWQETMQAQIGSATAPPPAATPTPTPWTGPAESKATPTPWTPMPTPSRTPTPISD